MLVVQVFMVVGPENSNTSIPLSFSSDTGDHLAR